MRATEHTPRGPFQVLERRYGIAEIVECGAFIIVERRRVITLHPVNDLEFGEPGWFEVARETSG